MRAITLWQPWASLIEAGVKPFETRSWPTSYRGPLVICAAKGGMRVSDLLEILDDEVFQEALSSILGIPRDMHTFEFVEWVRPFVSETIWIGKMNKVRLRVPLEFRSHVLEIERLQSDEQIMALYTWFKDDPVVRWKDSIKEVVARHNA